MILWKIHFFKGYLDFHTGFPTEIKNPPKKPEFSNLDEKSNFQ